MCTAVTFSISHYYKQQQALKIIAINLSLTVIAIQQSPAAITLWYGSFFQAEKNLFELQTNPRLASTLPFMARSRIVTPQNSVEVIEIVLRGIKSI